MKLTYDPSHNIGYLRFREKSTQVQTIPVGDELNVDIGEDGTIYGIELLNANEQLSADRLGAFVVVNQASGESAEIELPR